MNLKIRDNAVKYGMHMLNRLGMINAAALADIRARSARGVLVVVTTALGDAVFCTPLFRVLRAELPGVKIGLFVHRAFQDIFCDDPNLDVVIPYYGKFRRILATRKRLQQEGFDIALIANANDPDVIPLLYWSGIRALVRRPWKSTIYHYLISNASMMGKGQPPDHAIPLNLKMAEILGLNAGGLQKTFIGLNPAAMKRISQLLEHAAVPEDAVLVGFHPGASLKSKMWPAERYEELAQRLLRKYPTAVIVLSGSSKEAPICDAIARPLGRRALNTAGKLSLREVVALLQRQALFVSGDTGPFHLANALGKRTVTIFGPSDEKTNGPLWDLDIHKVIKNSYDCYYDNCARWCRKPMCMQDIPVERVWAACDELLESGVGQ